MLTIVTCAEDGLAARASQHLFRRALREESSVEHVRDNVDTIQFVGLEETGAWSRLHELPQIRERLAQQWKQQGRGRFSVHPPRGLHGRAKDAYLANMLSQARAGASLRVVLLAFDLDRQSREPVEEAVSAAGADNTCVLALAQPEFDAWVVCGFSPRHRAETEALDQIVDELKFDPVTQPTRLTSNVSGDARDAKKTCQRLLGLAGQAMGDEARVIACLDVPLATLRKNGAATGLAEFLDAVCARVDATQRPATPEPQ